MHILYIHQYFSTPVGAVGVRSYEMARRLISEGHSVTMVCGSYAISDTGLDGPFVKGRRRGVVDSIDVIELDLQLSNSKSLLERAILFISFSLSCISIVLRGKFDILFATSTPLTVGIPSLVCKWIRRKPYVFEVRDLWPELPREMGVITNPILLWFLSVLEWCSYRSAERCIALSPGIADGIKRRGISSDKVTLISNGCDIKFFSNSGIDPWRPNGVLKSDLLAVFAGAQGQANGLDAVLDAAVELKKQNVKNIKLVLIGQGKLTQELKSRVEAENLENVLMLPPVSKIKLARLFKATDIGLQCLANVPAFYYGTSPNKFFDYISAGLPVINNYPGWVADMVDENNCGFVVPPENALAFADALQKAADDKAKGGALLKRMGENSFKLAKAKFDRNDLSNKWVEWVTNEKTGT